MCETSHNMLDTTYAQKYFSAKQISFQMPIYNYEIT